MDSRMYAAQAAGKQATPWRLLALFDGDDRARSGYA